MNDRDRRIFEMAGRATIFLEENKSDFTSIPAAAAALTTLETETPKIGELGEQKVSAVSGAKDATISKGDLRDELMEAMRDVARMWRPMAKNYDNAQNKFRLPNGSDQLMIDTAGSFIEDAAPLKAAFIARGMPVNFIADLTGKRDEFAHAVNESAAAKMERVGINAGFENPVKLILEAVEDVDPIIKLIYRDNPQKLAEWLVASHVERRKPKTPPKS